MPLHGLFVVPEEVPRFARVRLAAALLFGPLGGAAV